MAEGITFALSEYLSIAEQAQVIEAPLADPQVECILLYIEEEWWLVINENYSKKSEANGPRGLATNAAGAIDPIAQPISKTDNNGSGKCWSHSPEPYRKILF